MWFWVFLAAPLWPVGSQFPDQGSNLHSLHRKRGVLTTGQPGSPETEDLEYHPQDDAILLPTSVFGLHQVLPTPTQAGKDLAAQGHRILNVSTKLWGIRKFFNYGSQFSLFFLIKKIFIYLTASGLSCSTRDLRCGTRDLSLWRVGSLLQHVGSRARGGCSCRTRALQLWLVGLVAPRQMGSQSPTRD